MMIPGIPALDVAATVARGIEQLLGHDVALTVGDPAVVHPEYSLLPDRETRTIALPFSGTIVGEVTLVVSAQFGTTMEAATPDASLVSACLPALEAATATIGAESNVDYIGEISTDTLVSGLEGDFVLIPILENEEFVACVVVRAVPDEPEPFYESEPEPEPVSGFSAPTVSVPELVPAIAVPQASPGGANAIALHQFQPLGDGGAGATSMRPITLLNDVMLEVTAELGRMRMKMRDLMALAPGSVIELDRAAGSPVDVLINGALLAHGEVVVIDEEFGVRVSEIVVGDN
jgi:flagellar motor switch protein FliN/FliY